MAKNQRKYTDEFRIEAVHLLEKSGQSVSEVAGHLGINEKALYRWRQKYGTGSKTDQNPSKNKQASTSIENEAELKRLRRENEILRQERDVLKKAISIVSRPPK